MSEPLRDHQTPGGGPSVVAAKVLGPEPDDAERARTLAAAVTTGLLSTLAVEPAGTPFGSIAPFGLDEQGRPVLCISELAEHTRNLHQDPRASVLVVEPVGSGGDPLAAGRVTLLGRASVVSPEGRDAAKAVHLQANPYAKTYIDFGDFSLWRVEVESIRYVGGYGRMSWVDASAWSAARPDPVAAFASGVVDHLNEDHADALLLMSHVLADRPDATGAVAVGVDRLGLELIATGPDGPGRVRLNFDDPATTPEAVRSATVALVHTARAANAS